MAKKKQVETVEIKAVETVPTYKGSQLLKHDKYNNRIGRIVIEADKYYSFAEADKEIEDFLNKKG